MEKVCYLGYTNRLYGVKIMDQFDSAVDRNDETEDRVWIIPDPLPNESPWDWAKRCFPVEGLRPGKDN